jgi:hypothetical protein
MVPQPLNLFNARLQAKSSRRRQRAFAHSRIGPHSAAAARFRLRFIVPSRREHSIQRQNGAHTVRKEYRFKQSSV